MEFSFREALDSLGRNAAFRIINEARPASEYLFNTLLPETQRPDYHVDNGYMLVRATMAGLVGMSSPYPPGGMVEVSTFLEKSAKLATEVKMEEETLREMQRILSQRGITGANRTRFIAEEAINFMDKVVVQGHLDSAEWLRSQALFSGAINWTFNKKALTVDYGVPASFFGTNRTGNDAYDGSASKFWADHYTAIKALNYNIRAIITHTDTLLKMLNNDVNKFELIAQENNMFTVRRYRTRGNIDVLSGDSRDRVTFITYDLEGEVLDPADPGATKIIQMVPAGKLLYVGNNRRSGYRVGEGSTPDPVRDLALGYTHVAPTVEGGGAIGRWGDMYTPENAPWALHARGVTNILPVREDVTATQAKTYVLSTDLS